MAEQKSLTQTVYNGLRNDILNGKYPSGTVITEEQIAKEFGASRSPVRSAFRQLEEIGLLRIVPNKGVWVEGITRDDMKDVYEIRMRIEGLASAEAARNATQAQIDLLTELADLSDFYFAHGNEERLKSLDGSFHEQIFVMSGRKVLHSILSSLLADVSRFRNVSMVSSGRLEPALQEHRAILNAIAARDPKQAEELTVRHIVNAYENIQRIFP